MNSDWQNFIKQQLDAASTQDQTSRNALCDLSHYGLIVIAGPDAADFMQGQFTNDITQVDENNMQLNAYCNNKGRMLASFNLFQYQENYFISLHQELVASSIEHLSKYVLQAQVAIQDVTDQLSHFGINGSEVSTALADELKKTYGITLSETNNAVTANEDYIVMKTGDDNPRYEIFAETAKAEKLWRILSTKAHPTPSTHWEGLNIQAGIPVIKTITSGEFVPQMANMERLGAVNFKKGCYTGQEIVARMHYLGKLKKRMYKIHISAEGNSDNVSDTPPMAGDTLHADNAKAGQNTGMIIDAQLNSNGGYDALAVIQNADIDSSLSLSKQPNSVIKIGTLPYKLTD